MKNTTKFRLQGFIAGLIICGILMLNSTTFALAIAKSIDVIFNSVTVRIDGKVLGGDNIYYLNNTYVRLDKVSELLNKTYSWDKTKNTIDLIDKTQTKVPAVTPAPAPDTATKPGAANSGQKVEEIVVNNADEFIKAIGSNRKIIMKPGVYNLSKVSNHDMSNKNIGWNAVYDGVELRISDVVNLSITGDGDLPVEIVTEPRFAVVLELFGCQNITLNNLKMGHTVLLEEYDCNAGVLLVNGSNNICIKNCTLYGCGSEGIQAHYSNSLKMENSVIEKCNLRIMTLDRCKNFTFTNCMFRETKHLDMFDLFCAENVVFTNCEIRDNISEYGPLFEVGDSVNIKVLNCKIINNKADELGEGMVLQGTTFKGNSFDKK